MPENKLFIKIFAPLAKIWHSRRQCRKLGCWWILIEKELIFEKDPLNGGFQGILHYLQRDTGMRHFMDGDGRDGNYDDGEDESDVDDDDDDDFAEGSGFIE